MTQSFSHCYRRAVAFYTTWKWWQMIGLSSTIGWLLRVRGLGPLSFSRITTIGLFLSAGWIIGLGRTIELNFEVLRTDSMQRASPINLEKEGKHNFLFKKLLYSSNIQGGTDQLVPPQASDCSSPGLSQ